MRISDWSSDVCSSDLGPVDGRRLGVGTMRVEMSALQGRVIAQRKAAEPVTVVGAGPAGLACAIALARAGRHVVVREWHRDVGARFHGDFQGLENRSEEHTSELQSLMRISYAVFCLKKKNKTTQNNRMRYTQLYTLQ